MKKSVAERALIDRVCSWRCQGNSFTDVLIVMVDYGVAFWVTAEVLAATP